MKEQNISQLPVMEDDQIIGSITETSVLSFILDNPLKNAEASIDSIMGGQFPIVDNKLSVSDLRKYITKEIPAVLTKDTSGAYQVITQYDIIQNL